MVTTLLILFFVTFIYFTVVYYKEHRRKREWEKAYKDYQKPWKYPQGRKWYD